MAAHQAPPSLGFSRQEHWSRLPFPSPMHESESEVTQSCPTLSDPMECSLPGSSIHGIFQERVLEWGAIIIGYCFITDSRGKDVNSTSSSLVGCSHFFFFFSHALVLLPFSSCCLFPSSASHFSSPFLVSVNYSKWQLAFSH